MRGVRVTLCNQIRVEVAYALLHKQKIISLQVVSGTNALEAVVSSNITQEFAEIDLSNLHLGIFGKKIAEPSTHILKAGERVEIYRPLLIDPQQARLNRLEKSKANKAKSTSK
jgi:putative ubiquitin-RnfH superfamily antitoxin RatB of RatAB toxin-antitoxin module